MKMNKWHCSLGPKLARPKSETGEQLLHGHGGSGRPIPTATGGEVGRGGALGLHSEVGDLLEVYRRGGLTGGVVSTGARLDRRGTVVMSRRGGGDMVLSGR
jgi:hypothetical protein